MWGLLAGAALGALQGQQQRKAQQEANQANANISAAQTEFSPWTKITPQAANIQAPTSSALGGAVQGGLGGAMFQQGLDQPDAMDEVKKQEMLKRGSQFMMPGQP